MNDDDDEKLDLLRWSWASESAGGFLKQSGCYGENFNEATKNIFRL